MSGGKKLDSQLQLQNLYSAAYNAGSTAALHKQKKLPSNAALKFHSLHWKIEECKNFRFHIQVLISSSRDPRLCSHM